MVLILKKLSKILICNEKILVTGGNGLVGRACQRCAKENNIDISIVSRKESLFSSTTFYSSLKEIPSNEN